MKNDNITHIIYLMAIPKKLGKLSGIQFAQIY